MKRLAHRHLFVAFVLLTPWLGAGCDRNNAGDKTAIAKPNPEERFRRILESFRRSVEGQPVGFVVDDGGTRSTLIGTNKVSSKLTPPPTADDHYTAVITVMSESRYSLRRTKNPNEDSEREQNAKNQGSSVLADPKDKKGIGILEPELAGKPGADAPPKTTPKQGKPEEEVVTRRPDETIRKYELTYDGDRWELVTQLDQKTERAIQFAFEEAIARQ